MNKIELKQLKNYLDTEVLVLNKDNGRIYTMVAWNHTNSIKNGIPVFDVIENEYYIPLFLPLSALTEPLPDGSIPIVELLKLKYPNSPKEGLYSEIEVSNSGYSSAWYKYCANHCIMINPYGVKDFMLWMSEYLFSNHFDLFGLIDAGLSLDKRTVKTD